MHWLTLLGIYFVAWWIVLFAVLPFGVKVPDQPEPGHASSAPERPYILRKALVTSVVAGVVTALIWLADRYDVFGIESWSP
jgi:predicted secreted protein